MTIDKQAIDFSHPLETESGEPVKYICHDVIEYKCARVCVDIATGIVYSSPYVGLNIRNKEANPRAKLREQIESAADAYWQFDNGWISDMKCSDLSHEYLLFVKEPKNVLALFDELEAAQKLATQQGNIAVELFDEVTRLQRSADDKAPELREQLEAAEKRIAELESKNGNLRTIAHEQNELAIRTNLDSINDAAEMDGLHKRIAETNQRNTVLTAKIEPMDRRIAELERSETQLINERDSAESALNDAYKAVMGQAPEWSNWFSFENAIDEIELACELWRNQTDDVIQFRQRIQELEAKLETADKLQDGAFRDGLKAGFSYGQTDDQSGFTQCMSAYSNAGIKVKE